MEKHIMQGTLHEGTWYLTCSECPREVVFDEEGYHSLNEGDTNALHTFTNGITGFTINVEENNG